MADSAAPGQSAGPPPLWGVISLLEVGRDCNPSAQRRGHNQPSRGGRKAPPAVWARLPSYTQATEGQVTPWARFNCATMLPLARAEKNHKTITIFSKPQWKASSQNDASNLSFYFSSIN